MLVLKVLDSREITELLTGASEANALFDQSKNHLRSANLICAHDPEGAVQLAYDAARKSVSALLREVGLRVHDRAGSHSSYLKVTTLEVFDQEKWQDLLWVRKLRNIAEYSDSESQHILAYQSAESIQASEAMVADASRVLLRLRDQETPEATY